MLSSCCRNLVFVLLLSLMLLLFLVGCSFPNNVLLLIGESLAGPVALAAPPGGDAVVDVFVVILVVVGVVVTVAIVANPAATCTGAVDSTDVLSLIENGLPLLWPPLSLSPLWSFVENAALLPLGAGASSAGGTLLLCGFVVAPAEETKQTFYETFACHLTNYFSLCDSI